MVLSAGEDDPVAAGDDPLLTSTTEPSDQAHLHGQADVLGDVALKATTPILDLPTPGLEGLLAEGPGIDPLHRPAEAYGCLGASSGSSKLFTASTIAEAIISGLWDLNMPEPTKTPSAPICIISEASAGWRYPRRRSSPQEASAYLLHSRTSSKIRLFDIPCDLRELLVSHPL